ncbi:M56 family metallopeptidase [Pseudoduganella violacea]|uniref:D-alanyl-D-alanine endopeptidase (Penicillin-binding protein 7) n=1 Tax=Pseudoduganella violacea TaxID=1715466 RepID=A0A7W5BCE0_9BURK|nr:M56 family metallopeptidase [Pseudoduganella violacea]MBB3120296.1 D-alanyl-D-alanine endopeptidase (penicillin-binding protein 7) [Pseudoduganella violacea]
MSGLIEALGWTLLDFLWQGVLLGAAACLTLGLLRHARPQQRYAAAGLFLTLCLLWPLLSLYGRLQGMAAAGSASGAASLFAVYAPADHWQVLAQRYLPLLVALWALCIAALGLRSGLGLWWLSRTIRRGGRHPVWQARLTQLAQACGLRRPVRLRVVDGLPSPVTAGWWRPVVLLPASLLSGLPPELLEALLAHELAHIRRHDYLVNLLQNAVETLLFYHPVVWWLSQRIRAERELIADDLAASQLGEPRRLALALSELEKLQFSTQRLALAANGGDLMARIKHLIQPEPQRVNWKAVLPALGLAAACLGGFANATTDQLVSKPDTAAVVDFSSCKKPVWPQAALTEQRTGTVTLGFVIGADGKVKSSEVHRSSGHADLDAAARDGIALCSFKPAQHKGKAVASRKQIQYVWTLE